jgi:hypothetical protein
VVYKPSIRAADYGGSHFKKKLFTLAVIGLMVHLNDYSCRTLLFLGCLVLSRGRRIYWFTPLVKAEHTDQKGRWVKDPNLTHEAESSL